jgi:hypothetical protein
VKLEETAALMFLLCLLLLVVSVFSIRVWDSVVRPIVELTGALVYAVRYPVLFAGMLWALFAFGRRLRRL